MGSTKILFTDLGSLMKNLQCENFKILREIIVSYYEAPKTASLTIWAALNIDFWEFLTFSSVKFFQKSMFKDFKIVTTGVLDHLNSVGKNWFHVKSEWKENPEISTMCIPN